MGSGDRSSVIRDSFDCDMIGRGSLDMKEGENADDIFGRLSWCTTASVDSATLWFWKDGKEDEEEYDERALTREELSLAYFPFDGSIGEYVLVNPCGALGSDGDPISTAMVVRNGCSVGEVLERVYEMTVREGEFAAADRVYFEGLEVREEEEDGRYNILMVILGS